MDIGTDVDVGASLQSILGKTAEIMAGSATGANMEALIRGGLKEAGIEVSNTASRSVQFGMAATGVTAKFGQTIADAGMQMAQGINQAMQSVMSMKAP
jgi:hypothetical protein